jgi:CBS domain-containing protein
MKVIDLMTRDPACGARNTSLQQIAQMMVDCDCGMIPIVEQNGRKTVVGTVTDRDITIRAIANGKNPLELTADDVMSSDPICINQNASDSEAEQKMSSNQIRRLLVLNDQGELAGVVAQADVAREDSKRSVGKVVERISQPPSAQRPRP